MAGTLNSGRDPTGELVRNMGPAGTAGAAAARAYVRQTVIVPVSSATRTAWVNPEIGTVFAEAFYFYTTAGTGTVDMGTADDGTAAGSSMIDGGTMTVGAHYAGTVLGTVDASSTVGGVGRMYYLIGPGGSGTSNSITITNNEGGTSTAVGGIIVSYVRINTL